MTDMNKRIIQMLDENKSIREIARLLGISEKQLFINIKCIIKCGYQLKPSYCYNSDIYYTVKKNSRELGQNQISIKFPKNTKEFRCIAISDLHIGNTFSNINLVNIVYDYAVKNNINNIMIAGDLIEGDYTTDSKKISDVHSQVDVLIKKYPYDSSINNYIVFGNHDYHSLYYNGLDISKWISNARYDMIPIGFGKGIVKLRSDKLLIEHKLSVIEQPNIGNDCKIVLVGHGHMMKTKLYDKLYICLPTLSNVSPDKTKDVIPGFIDLNINFENGYFEYVKVKHMALCPNICQVSESRTKIKEK